MTPIDFDYLAQMLKRRSGLVVTRDKVYLLETRLMPVARTLGIETLEAMVAKLRAGDEVLARTVTEAMTTNESFFFRDKTPFDQFEKVMLPALLKARAANRKLRIWCAAASTGQEPYSIAMLLKEKAAQVKDWNIEILGTDLSTDVLARAKAGLYSQFEVQRGLPIQFLMKYFAKEGDQWRVREDVRAMVHYRPLNLLDPFTGLGTFDIVFCRNVLIYFDEATKKNVLDRLAQLLTNDGYLSLGAAETVLGITDAFAPIIGTRGLYEKQAARPVLKQASA